MAANARPSTRKSIVDDFFRLVGEGRPRDGLRYFSPGCVQHNPHVNGGIDALFDSMMAAMKEKASKISQPDFSVRYVLEDRDTVAVYTQLYNRSKPEMGGQRQVHLFRFGEDKIVEYWDITQQIGSSMPNVAGAF